MSQSRHSPLLDENPNEGTVGPIVGTVIVILILCLGAWVSGMKLYTRIQDKRALEAAGAAGALASTSPATTTDAPAE